MDVITCISQARKALSKASRLSDVVEVRNSSEAIRVYIKSIGESLEAQNAAADIRICCERKAGVMLSEMELVGRGGGDTKSSNAMSLGNLSDLGISKQQSSRWQLEASLPEDDYQAIKLICNAISKELTQSCVLSAARKRRDLLDPFEEDKTTPVADLMELIGEVRAKFADWVERFGPERLDSLSNVVKSELADMEVSV